MRTLRENNLLRWSYLKKQTTRLLKTSVILVLTLCVLIFTGFAVFINL